MTISKFRGILYAIAKYSGDVQALRSSRKGATVRRVLRRIAGNITGRMLGRIFR